MNASRIGAGVLCCALAVGFAASRPSHAQTPEPAQASPAAAQGVPAVIDFKNRGDYKGDVELDYDRHPGVATPGGAVSFDDGRRHRRGYVARPNGPGTYTSPDGTTFYDEDFVNGLAEGWGKLVVPRSAAAAGLTFEGLFHDSAPVYGLVTYADGSSYRGYFSGGCYGSAPATPPVVPPAPKPGTPLGDDFPVFAPFAAAGTYANAAGASVTGLWQHAGESCAAENVTNARVAYANGDVYLGDVTGERFTGPGAFYTKPVDENPSATLLCGTRGTDGTLVPGRYTLWSGTFEPDLANPGGASAICGASYGPDVTLLTATIPAPGAQPDGTADVAFANGDRETVRVAASLLAAGDITGTGTYEPHAYPATISGTFVRGRLGPVAYLTDSCGNRYRMRVRSEGAGPGAIVNDPLPGAPAYLFHACDRFIAKRGGSVDGRGRPDGPGTKILTTGQTVDGVWQRGRLVGNATIGVLQPYRATIVVTRVNERDGRLYGNATVRFTNGDVAHGYLKGYALDGPGDYAYASTGCTARGVFLDGKLHGRVVLACPDHSTYAGTVGPDGSVQ